MTQIPTVDEMRNKFINKKYYFTLCDLKDELYQCELERGSIKYCALSTPFCSYQFKRIPFGLANAPKIFQQLTSKYCGCIENICVNIKLNLKKLQYRESEVRFLGMIFSIEGIKPDPERVKSIVELKIPQNIKELESFLEMINYLIVFIPNMPELVEPLRGLLRKNVVWSWDKSCESVFIKLKQILTGS